MRRLVETSPLLPLVLVSVTFPRGAAAEPQGHLGITRALAELYRRGCLGPEPRDEAAMALLLDGLGAELRATVGLSHVTLTLEVLRRNLEPAVEALATILRHPRFTEADRARTVDKLVGDLLASRDDDAELCRRALRAHLFGEHPHGRHPMGTAAGLESITLADLRAHHQRLIGPDDAILGVAGDVDEGACDMIQERLGACLGGGVDRSTLGAPVEPVGRHLVVVDKPGRAQVQLGVATLGTHPLDPDQTALEVGVTIFGGTHTSLLTQAIRVDRGWSYDASASLSVSRVREMMAFWAAPAEGDAPACLAEMLRLFSTFLREGVEPAQVAFARRYLRGSWAFEVDTADKRLFLAVDRALYGLPRDHHERYLERLEAVTAESVNGALRTRLSADNLWVAAVGGAERQAPWLGAALGGDGAGVERAVVVPYDE